MSERTAAEIRHDIDLQRQDLGRSVEALRGRVTELTDWRRKVHEHRSQLIVGAAVAADLGDEGWLAAEDFATVVDQAGGGLVVLDVLDDPGVEVGVVALAGIVAQALDRAGPGADTLHRGDLLLQGEDRLDLQRRANEGAGAADPAAAPQVLERVDREPHLQLLTGLLSARHRCISPSAAGSGRRGAARAEAHSAGRRARIENLDSLAALAFVDEALAGLAGRLAGAGDTGRDMDRGDLAASVEQRLVDGDEVAD